MAHGFRLARHVAASPLVAGWPAWWGNVSPLVAAQHALHHQIRLVASYLKAPDLHIKASSGDAAKQAAFLGFAKTRIPEVEAWLRGYEATVGPSLELARAYRELSDRVVAEAKGQNLDALRATVPAPLRGLVELVYDYHNRAQVRVEEPLLYRSEHYRPALQSVELEGFAHDDERRFFLSDVRLEGGLRATRPFADPAWDGLARLDLAPTSREDAARVLHELGFDARAEALLEEGAARVAPPWEGRDVRVTYLGHATVLLERGGTAVLVDPLLSVVPTNAGDLPRFSFEQLPARLDAVVITHAHPDHFDAETLLRLRARTDRVIVPRSSSWLHADVSLALLARALGFGDVVELDSLGEVKLGAGDGAMDVVALPFRGEHGDVGHANKAIWLVGHGTDRVLFAADSAAADRELYERVAKIVGPVPTLFVSTEALGSPLSWTFDAVFPPKRDRKLEVDRRCRAGNAAECMNLVDAFGCTAVYNYAMGLEPWLGRIIGPPAPYDDPRMVESRAFLAQLAERGVAPTLLRGSQRLPTP